MSNSSRIEKATRDHVGAVLTGAQIIELVKVSQPDWKGGVYPSDAAGKLMEDGTITFRGKVAYGDLVLLYLAENSFKVLADNDIIRRPSSKKPAVAAPAPVAAAPVVVEAKKSAKSASKPPVAPKSKARVAQLQ
jgi:hypothetical protein